MRNRYFELLFIVSTTVANIVWTLLHFQAPLIGSIIALPLVFLLPGYTLAKLMLYDRISDKVYLLVLSIGLSVVISIANGFILNMFSFGLEGTSWAISLGLISSFFSLLSVFFKQRSSININMIKWKTNVYKYFIVGVAITVVVLSFWYSAIAAAQRPDQSFTQLWMLPSKQPNQSCNVLIGIHSFEATTTSYRIVMTINGTQATNWTSIALTPQQEWKQSVPLNKIVGNAIFIEAQLYRADKPDIVYREVHMRLNILTSNNKQAIQCTL